MLHAGHPSDPDVVRALLLLKEGRRMVVFDGATFDPQDLWEFGRIGTGVEGKISGDQLRHGVRLPYGL